MLTTKTVYCPNCKRKVMTTIQTGVVPVSVKCKNCNLMVVYHPDTDKTVIQKIPERTQSSGKRLY